MGLEEEASLSDGEQQFKIRLFQSLIVVCFKKVILFLNIVTVGKIHAIQYKRNKF